MNGKKFLALALGLALAVVFSWSGQTFAAAVSLIAFGALAASLAATEKQPKTRREEAGLDEKAHWKRKELLALGAAKESLDALRKKGAADNVEADADTPSWGELAELAGVKGFSPFARLGEGWVCEFALKDGVAYEFEGVGEPDMATPDQGLWIHGLIYAKAKDQEKWLEKAKSMNFLGEGEEDLPVGAPTEAQASRSADALARAQGSQGAA